MSNLASDVVAIIGIIISSLLIGFGIGYGEAESKFNPKVELAANKPSPVVSRPDPSPEILERIRTLENQGRSYKKEISDLRFLTTKLSLLVNNLAQQNFDNALRQYQQDTPEGKTTDQRKPVAPTGPLPKGCYETEAYIVCGMLTPEAPGRSL